MATTTAITEPATEIAAAFLDAYGSYDVGTAASYLSDDPSLSRLEGGRRDWKLGNRWLQAQGFQLILDPCEASGDSLLGTAVRCEFDYHALRSDELGIGPFGGSYFDITVLDGEIVSVAMTWAFIENGFSTQVWEPFALWVAEAHPQDAAIMYTDDAFTFQALTEDSIRLWEQHSKDYVEFIDGG